MSGQATSNPLNGWRKNRAVAAARGKEFSTGGKPFAFNSQPAERDQRFNSNHTTYRGFQNN
jgi:hypothetical protein